MAHFKSFAPDVEVIGANILAVLEGMPHTKNFALEVLAENGIVDPLPGQWYSQQAYLNAFKAIAEKIGPFTLFEIGKNIPDNVVLPPGVDSFEDVFSTFNQGYQMNHRGGATGCQEAARTGDRSLKVISSTPYPCEFERGVIEGFAMKFKPEGASLIVVKHDDSQSCRQNEADSCTYLVSW